MAIKYIVSNITPLLGDTLLTGQDQELIASFKVNQLFNPGKHFIEAHYYIDEQLFFSETDYRRFRVQQDSESAGKQGASRIVLDPETDVKGLDFTVPETVVEYRYYNDLYTTNRQKVHLFIESISEDRTELLLLTNAISQGEILDNTARLRDSLISDSPFNDFLVLLGDNRFYKGINIDTLPFRNTTAVVVKLYAPLPEDIEVKTQLQVVESVSDVTVFSVQAQIEEFVQPARRLSEPNFNVETLEGTETLTDYFNLDTLLSLDTGYNSDLAEVVSKSEMKSIEINIDYSSFDNFINYSSAVERLNNFKHKVELIQGYENTLSQLSLDASTSLSRKKLQTLIEGVVKNFDHYERFLYFEKSDFAWPKTGSNKPYTLVDVQNSTAVNWFTQILSVAEIYDTNNVNRLISTIPLYLREDERNDPYLLFIDMVGHHFDNLWIYVKAVSNKHDADNRLDKGISKDLIEEVLKNFGVKLYTDTSSAVDLFRYFTTGGYDQQDEIINTFVTGVQEDISSKSYTKEIYKRIYHNLPLLLKTKGTERSVRTLITCFGIPSDRLPIKQYGGVDRDQRPYFAQSLPYTGSVGKVRLSNQGNIQGTTLSSATSIVKDSDRYTLDLHRVEVGFSPTDNVNEYILSQIDPLFNIDQYLGDPTGKGYRELKKVAKSIVSNLGRYDLKDFIRLIKFFDNRLFKMVKDFTPARTVTDTGIIIKPHLLEWNVYDSLSITAFEDIITGSIDTAFISGSDGGSFGAKSDYITSWVEDIQTPDGIVLKPQGDLVGRTDGETPRYTGEFSGSVVEATDGELNRNNPFKKLRYEDVFYTLRPIRTTVPVCTPLTGTAVFQN